MTAELEIVGSPRLLAGTRGDITVRCYRDGVLTTPSGTLTFSVVDADGTAVASGTPTTTPTEPGVITATLTAAQAASMNRLTVTWGGLVFGTEPAVSLTTQHEVVGDLLFTLAEARAFDNGAMASQVTYSDDALLRFRDAITDKFEDILGFPPGRRYRREIHDGDGGPCLWVNEHVGVTTLRAAALRTAGSSTWTALTAAELADCIVRANGEIVRETQGYWTKGTANVRVSYECSDLPIPGELRRAGLLVLRKLVVPSPIDMSVTQQVSEIGTFVYSQPGMKGSYVGIPEVDEILRRLSRRMPAFA